MSPQSADEFRTALCGLGMHALGGIPAHHAASFLCAGRTDRSVAGASGMAARKQRRRRGLFRGRTLVAGLAGLLAPKYLRAITR